MSDHFWREADRLCATCDLVTDRPGGSPHPRFPEWVYPIDYGYLEGTSGGDGEGIDVWIGSAEDERVTGIVCTVDPYKQDSEVKFLWRCTVDEVHEIRRFYDGQPMKVMFVER